MNKKIVQQFIQYNLELSDIDKAKEIFGDISPDILQELLSYDPYELSLNQRMLIVVYLHLYASLHKKNLFDNQRLKKARELLLISDSFVPDFSVAISQFDTQKILNGRTPLEAIINPLDELTMWVVNLIFTFSQNGIYTKKKNLDGLKSMQYEHPLDAKALRVLEGTPGIELLVRKFNEYGLERLSKVNYTGSNIKVTETNFPDIYKILVQACTILDVHPMPDLYIKTDFMNAWTLGVEKPIIVLASGCIGLLTYDELLFMIGHELGHIKSQHVLYHQMADALPILSGLLSSVTLGLGGALSIGLEVALLNWYRKSEFTADRAGLIACQNIDAATTVLMKLAGSPVKYYDSLNPEEFKKQAKEFEGFDEDNLDKTAKVLSVMFADHPWTVMRAQELYKWVDNDNYDSLLKGQVKEEIALDEASNTINLDKDIFCLNCGYKYKENELFCPECGQKRKT